MVMMDIDKTLLLLEKSRQESVQEKVEEKVKKFEKFNETLVEESEQELKLIRHKHLLATLKRLKSYKEEYDELVAGINRHEDEMELKGHRYQDKLNEIEKTIKQAVEEAKKSTIVPSDEVNSKVDENSNVEEVKDKVEDDKSKTDETIVTEKVNDEKVKSETTSPEIEISNDLKGSAETETFTEYIQLQRFCIDFENSLQNFINDTKFKGYRNNLSMFINTLICTISQNTDLRHRASQLNRLFSKQSVEHQDSLIDCNSHPDALNFCLSFAAKTSVAYVFKKNNASKTAFSTGTFIGMIWSKYPTYGKLFLGILQEKCPLLVPYYPEREKDESEVNHLIAKGYCLSRDGTIESEQSYLRRMKALVEIYGVIVQSNIRNHPRGIKYAWKWLSNTLRLPPQPLITASILDAFLRPTSFKLYNLYGKQFVKLLYFIETIYMPMIASSANEDAEAKSIISGLADLIKGLLNKIRESRCLDEPLGLIRVVPENF